MDFISILCVLSASSALVPILVGWRMRGLLWYYALSSGICDGLIYLHLFPGYSQWPGNAFLAGQFALVSVYFIQELLPAGRRGQAKTLVFSITAAFLFYTVWQGFWKVNYPAGAALYGLLIVVVLGGFYRIMQKGEVMYLERSPFFVFCAAFLLYVVGSFLIMVFVPRLFVENRHSLILIWVAIHNSLNILKNVAIARALYLYIHPKKANVCA